VLLSDSIVLNSITLSANICCFHCVYGFLLVQFGYPCNETSL
jgi:hypothetical protein